MRYLTLHEVLEAHERILQQSGGGTGVLNLGTLESALGFSLIQDHPCYLVTRAEIRMRFARS